MYNFLATYTYTCYIYSLVELVSYEWFVISDLWPDIGQPLARHRPNIGQTLAKHRPNIGQTSAQHWPDIGQNVYRNQHPWGRADRSTPERG